MSSGTVPENLSAEEKRALLAERLRARKKRQNQHGQQNQQSQQGQQGQQNQQGRQVRRKQHRFPASFPQRRMWFLDQLTPGTAANNVPAAVRLTGPLDIDLWRRATEQVALRHETLRTVFDETDGEPVQVVTDDLRPLVTVVDCGHLKGRPDEQEQIQALAKAEFRRPFDLRTGPLTRMTFLRLAENEHVLVYVIHHIAGDLWSTSIFFGELIQLYTSYVSGTPAALPELPIQYADYAAWQQERLSSPAVDTDLEYWKKSLAGAPTALELPTDRPRPAVQSEHGASRPFKLPASTMERIREFSRAEGATAFMTVLAAFQVLLHRISREEDLVVGVPVANRGRTEIEPLIGYFVNMLPLRTDLSGAPSFRQLLERVRQVCLGGFAHQELPFERLVEELRPPRDLSRSPVFQVSFVFQNVDMPGLETAGLRVEFMDVESSTARFDLELQVFDRPEGLSGWFEYNTDLFDAATIETMARHLEVLFDHLLTDPDRPVGEVPMLTEDEQERSRRRATGRRDWPGPFAAHRRFEERAARTPGAEAVRCGEDAVDYAELDRRANRLAHRLVRHGVGRDVLVGICMDRSVDMVVALLAVLKAGGAYVPIDPGFPVDRIAFMLQDSALPVLLTRRAEAGHLPPVDATVLCLDELAEELSAEPAEPPAAEPDPEDLAYVIYTSGSTGRPKGVQIPHRALGNFLRSMGERPGLTAGDSLLAVTTFSFDIAMLELLLPLVEGGRTVLADRATASDGARLAELIGACGATVMQATPSTWRMLLDAGWKGVPGLRVLAGGEALPADLAERLPALGMELWNMYGPTETTIWSAVARIAPGDPVTLGEPIANTELHVLDDAGRPVPQGVPGELCVGGDGLARGYLGRPELTRERFVPHPFGNVPGDRLYRTGDLVRRRHDGGLQFLGRLDHQVKLRGFRIELGEIEATLLRHPSVREAVVLVREDVPGNEQLVAYLVPGADGAPDPRELRSALGERLPGYMVPAAFVVLEAMPLTPNQKIDRRALPAPDSTGPDRSEHTAPRDAVETTLHELFTELTGRGGIGIDDSFFELGGHSLLATRLVSRIRAAFGVELHVRTLFEEPTVAGLARRLGQARDTSDTRPALTPAARPEELPLSFAQRRLWFLHRLEGPSATYNIPAALRLSGSLDTVALGRALGDVVARHEALRTVFPDTDGVPRQRVLPVEQARPELEVSKAEPDELDEAVRAVVRHPFDLTRELPLYARLFAVGSDEHILALTFHHIAADAWSMAPLTRDLTIAYTARREGREPDWAPLPVQYADHTLWQQQVLGEKDDPDSLWNRQLDHWRQVLTGLPERIALPTDRPHPAEPTYRGEVLSFRWDAGLREAVASLARDCGATMFMVVQAALAALYHRLGAGDDIPLGTAVAGRTDTAAEELIGLFVNSLPLRLDVSGHPTFRELVSRVRESGLDAQAHQDIPFDALVDALAPTRSTSHHPLFQTVVAWQNTPDAVLELPELTVRAIPVFTGTARMDLSFLLEDRRTPGSASGQAPDVIEGHLEYNTDVYDRQTVENLLRRLRILLTEATADPGRRIGDIDLLTPAERHRELVELNDTARPTPHGSLPEIFEAQAAKTPDAVALAWDGGRLTYAELDAEAARLARRLVRLGVGPDTGVALLMERSPALVVAITAVIKAGGAYVPLDPRYPLERQRLILEETGTPVLLVDAPSDDPAGGPASELPAGEGVHVLAVDPVRPPVAAGDGTVERTDPDSDQLAYVMYTSGSTGTPKGIEITQRNVVGLAHDRRWRNGRHTRVLMHSPTAFDASTYELWVPLLSGGRVVVGPAGPLDLDLLAETIVKQGVTSTFFTSTLFNLLVERHPEALAGMREVLTGGEAASPHTIARALKLCPDTEFVNGYGPTETTTFAVTHAFRQSKDGSVPIGLPMDNTRAYILDENLHPVPPGVPGELYLAGEGLARGYLGRPALTAERFLRDPFGPEGEQMYRTGDLVRRLPEGWIDYLGRTDTQVKIRGFRIEPGEIESALTALPGIGAATVTVRRRPGGGKELIGYVVASEGEARPDPVEIRERLAGRLPAYMVPAAVMVLDVLPMTANQKVDHAALPDPEFPAAKAPSRGPATPVEKALCEAYASVLGLPEVGVDTGFFDLGGDSIMATQLVARVRQAGLVITVRDIFAHQTVAQLATVATRVGEGSAVAAVSDTGTGEVLPTPVMERQRLLGGPVDGFTMAAAVVLPPDVTLEPLTAALRTVLDHHEMLRSRLVVGAGGGWRLEAFVTGTVEAAECLRRVRTDGLSEADARARQEAEAKAARQRIAPEEGVMLQALWFDDGARQPGRLLLIAHHLVVDGVSWRILLTDLRAAWEAVAAGRPAELAPTGTSMRRWARLLTARAASGALTAELPLWQEVLEGAMPLVDGTPDPARDLAGNAGKLTSVLPAEDTRPLLEQTPGAFGGRIQDVLLTALGTALTKWRTRRTGQASGPVVVDVESHGRHEDLSAGVELSRTIGWFTSISPVRPALVGDDPAAAVRETGRRLREVPYHGLGYGLLRHLNPETAGALAELPAPQAVFNYLGRVPAAAADAPWSPLPASAVPDVSGSDPASSLPYPLEINAIAQDGPDGPELVANWTWAPALLDEEAVRELAEEWQAALRDLTAHAGQAAETARPKSPAGPRMSADAALHAPIPAGVDRSPGIPLSFGQLEFLLQPVGPDNAHHNAVAAWQLTGKLDEPALRACLDELLLRHDILRTRYVNQGSRSLQFVQPATTWPVEAYDLRDLEPDVRAERLRELVDAEMNRSFRIADGNLARALLFRLADDVHTLALNLHHIIVDHWGFQVLVEELNVLYRARVRREPSPLPDVEIQHLDYAAWERGLLADGAFDDHVAYWRAELRDMPRRLDFRAPEHQRAAVPEGFTHSFVLEATTTKALKERAQQEGVTAFMVLMAAYQLLLSAYSDSDDIVMSHPLSGRERPETQRMVGPFVAILAARSRMKDNPTFRDLVQRVYEAELEAYAHQNVPLRALITDGVVGDNPLPLRILFNMLGVKGDPLDLEGLTVEPARTGVGDDGVLSELITVMRPHNLDLYLMMREHGDEMRGMWLFQPECVRPEVMGVIAHQWPATVDLVLRHPELPVADLRALLLGMVLPGDSGDSGGSGRPGDSGDRREGA